jgi:beta-glucosidase
MVTEALYRDAGAPLASRVADLIERMTLLEKVAQLGSIWAFELVGSDGVRTDRLPDLVGDGIGEITRLAGSTTLEPRGVAEAANALQRFLVEQTRLGIPAIIHEECLHGLLASGAPSFQQSIGAAATFDPDLVREVADTIRRRMLATGGRHALAPVLDVSRDPRWGRIEETYGEDPYLAAAMGVAYVNGLQGEDPAEGVLATGKHFAGHGLGEGGLNQAPAHAGWRELRDEQLVPFEAAIREAGLATIMPAYNDLDGVPCHASVELLATVLRGEWGFDGLVASDYLGIEQLVGHHRLTPDMDVAARLALEAGVDSELPRSNAYAEGLVAAVEAGRVDPSLVDAAAARVLAAKFQLGVFEQPYIDVPSAEALAALTDEERRLGRRLAARSLVLLENDGLLPLERPGRVAVIGPLADSARDLQGDYSHVAHVETLMEMRTRNNPFGAELIEEMPTTGLLSGRRTILDALRERFGAEAVSHAPGCGIGDGSADDIAAAVAAASAADVAVVVLGERSGLTDDSTTGEARDRRDLGLIGRQQELLEAVVGTGTPVALVVVSGRPLALEWAAANCAAIVLAWVPGDEGPDAIADLLSGTENPGGKLPISMPRHVGQMPLSYRHHPSGGRSNWKVDYVDGKARPLWPFGFGRSYTAFELAHFGLSDGHVPTDGGRLTVSVDVANVGDRAGDEVVQLYARDEEASVARPVRELIGFRRISLEPGERRTVSFELEAEQFAYTGADYRRVVEPGRITLFVGTSSADLPLSGTVELVGASVAVPRRQRFVTPTRIR